LRGLFCWASVSCIQLKCSVGAIRYGIVKFCGDAGKGVRMNLEIAKESVEGYTIRLEEFR